LRYKSTQFLEAHMCWRTHFLYYQASKI